MPDPVAPAAAPVAPVAPVVDPVAPVVDPAAPVVDPDASILAGGDPAAIDYATVAMPEGQSLDPALLTEYGPALQEANVTAEQAEKLFPVVNKILEQREQASVDAYVEQQTADREIIGAIAPEKLAEAKEARDRIFGDDPAAMAALEGRYGDLPWVVNGLVKLGAMMKVDTFIEGQGGAAAAAPAETILYPTMAK